jgi:uncharacterized repeat protein (TIGR01451 family)/gliding motility-associated-like protein
MNKLLLLIFFFISASFTLSYGQSEDILGNASSYAVLASTQINNNGQTGITGNVGVSPGNTIIGEAGLVVKSGKIEKNTPSAISAKSAAQSAYNNLLARGPATIISNELGVSSLPMYPGVYKINGDASFKGVITLDGKGDVNSVFIFIIDGNLLTNAPAAGVLAMNGAQPKNVYWVVTGDVHMGGSTGFQGTILANGNITLDAGVVVIGRVMSMSGQINLNSNNIFLPNVVVTDLGVTKKADEGSYLIGDEITYTITAYNNGPGTATNIEVQENIPPGLEFVRVESISTGTYDAATHIWSIPTLVNTGSATLRIVFKITGGGSIKNSVSIVGKDPDPNPGDNTQEEPIDVPEVSANLSVTKTASPGPYKIGEMVTYTIVATNNGPYTATNVKVTDALPTGLQYQSHTTSTGSYNPATGVYVVGDLANGATATLTIVAKIVGAGTIVNIATVSSPNQPDPVPGDNKDEEPIDVTCDAPTLVIEGNSNICAGDEVTYRVTEVTGGTYTYTLPDGFTEISRTATTITVKAGNTSGTLKVKVKDLCGNEYTATKDITVTAKPVITINGPAEVCANSEGLTFTVSGAGEGVTYEWKVTGGLTLTSVPGAATATIKSGTTGGTISVKVTNSCFESDPAVKTITILPIPDKPEPVTGTTELCADSKAIYEIKPVAGATGYTWKVPTGWTITDGHNTTKIEVLAGSESGEVTVTADNACGSSEPLIFTVKANNVPAAATIEGDAGACIGATLTYSVTPVAGATDYKWTVPTGWTIDGDKNKSTIKVIVGDKAGDITLIISNGCGDGATATLAVAPVLPPDTPVISGPAEVCRNSKDIVFSVPAVAGTTGYKWVVPTGWKIIDGVNTSSITVTATETGGQVSVIITNSCGDSNPGTFDVKVTTPPTAIGPIQDKSTLCDGLIYSIAATPGATSYAWSVPAGFTITEGQGTLTIKVRVDNDKATGNVTVVGSTNGCAGAEATLPIDLTKVNGNLSIPKAFSPNGDGKNDTWVITNLENYTANEVTIFNRWGTEVYKKKDYQNNWNGNGLEQGTYFYKVIVKLCSGKEQAFTGYVTIFR